MADIHTPTTRQAVGFFIFTIVATAGIIIWIFFINKGTLIVSSVAPFTLKIRGEEMTCGKTPCLIKTKSGKLSLLAKKEGYFDVTREVSVARLASTEVVFEFTFIPVVREAESPPEFSKVALPAPSKTKPAYTQIKNGMAYIENRLDGGQKLIEEIAGRTEVIVEFDRPLQNPQLLANAAGTYILAVEKTDAGNIFYLIGIEQRSRKRLTVSPESDARQITASKIVFSKDGKMFLFGIDGLGVRDFPASPEINVAEKENGDLLFMTGSDIDSSKAKIGVTIDEAIKEAKRENTATGSRQPLIYYVTEWDSKADTYRTLASVPTSEAETIGDFMYDAMADKIYFTKGDKWFEVKMR